MFETSQSAKGVSEVTLRNYKYHLSNISKYLDTQKAFETVSKRDIESMIVEMRRKQLSNNTMHSYFIGKQR